MAALEPRKILVPAGFLLALLLPVSEALSQVDEEKTPRQRLTAAREYLRSNQNEDGAWANKVGYKLNFSYVRLGEGPHVGVTALCALALLSSADKYKKNKYKKQIDKAAEFVLHCSNPDTGFIRFNKTRMYSHGYASLFLLEYHRKTKDERAKNAIESSFFLLRNCQGESGGWGYMPFHDQPDSSHTSCQLHFLVLADSCGFKGCETTIARARGYLGRCLNRPLSGGFRRVGGFRYEASRPASRCTFALTAASLLVFKKELSPENELDRKGIEYLKKNIFSRGRPGRNDFHYFYGHFYAALLFRKLGGESWKFWKDKALKPVFNEQRDDGSWFDEIGRNYATAMAILILDTESDSLLLHKTK